MSQYPRKDKVDEFSKYLDESGTMDLIQKALKDLNMEPVWPEDPIDAVNYLRKKIGGSGIEKLRDENTKLKVKASTIFKS